MSNGILYLIATPIGNLEDITLRALRTLKEVDLIACEDTRHTQRLLNHFGIKRPTISYHEHNEEARTAEIVAVLERGQSVALVSDAGTPVINDPGHKLVVACLERELPIVPVPGPAALVAALVVSGLATDEFFFGGFLPARQLARRQRLQAVKTIPGTLIFYEAPHRLHASLADARDVLGAPRRAAVARELTKIHEETRRGTLGELADAYGGAGQTAAARGEIVLLIGPADASQLKEEAREAARSSLAERVAALEGEGVDHKTALKRVAREMGLARDEAYRRLIAERSLKS